MNLLADKIILLILNIFAMEKLLHGKFAVVIFYVFIIFQALLTWLLLPPREFSADYEKKERAKRLIAFWLEMIFAVCMLAAPVGVVLLPSVTYDMKKSRNIPAFALSAVALVGATSDGSITLSLFVYTLTLILLSVLMSYRTEKLNEQTERIHRLRDDDEETRKVLREKQDALMKSMGNEIYTAQLQERNRIARDIHDNVGHMLSRGLLQTGAMLAIHKGEPVEEELASLRETLDTAMNSIRESVHDLRDESVDLDYTVRHLVQPLESDGKHIVNLELDFSQDMPGKVKYAIMGIIKECVSNIIRHSQNPCVDIKITEHPFMYQIIVHDYPKEKTEMNSYEKKFDGTWSAGMGLSNITSRAETLGGSARITTENGFRVFVMIPREA